MNNAQLKALVEQLQGALEIQSSRITLLDQRCDELSTELERRKAHTCRVEEKVLGLEKALAAKPSAPVKAGPQQAQQLPQLSVVQKEHRRVGICEGLQLGLGESTLVIHAHGEVGPRPDGRCPQCFVATTLARSLGADTPEGREKFLAQAGQRGWGVELVEPAAETATA